MTPLDPVERNSAPLTARSADDLAASSSSSADSASTDKRPAADDAGGLEISPWRRLARAMRPRASKAQLTAALLCAVLGFAAVVQVHQYHTLELSGLRESDLVELLDRLTKRTAELSAERNDLQAQRDQLVDSQQSRLAALEAAQERQRVQGILAGTLPVAGPGLRLMIYDSERKLTAGTIFHLIEELRNAGAEAISVGQVRVTGSSWVLDSAEQTGIVVDGVTLTPPYDWTAIGDPHKLEVALAIPGGALAMIQAAGAETLVTTSDRLVISAVKPLPNGGLATPVPEE